MYNAGFFHESLAEDDLDNDVEVAGLETRDSGLNWQRPLCEQHGQNLSVFTADGNVYCPPVPLDYEFHAMVSCCEIGAAVAVSSVNDWGPCIFFTEDHRSFFTVYEPPASPSWFSPIYPGNAISGNECGSGF